MARRYNQEMVTFSEKSRRLGDLQYETLTLPRNTAPSQYMKPREGKTNQEEYDSIGDAQTRGTHNTSKSLLYDRKVSPPLPPIPRSLPPSRYPPTVPQSPFDESNKNSPAVSHTQKIINTHSNKRITVIFFFLVAASLLISLGSLALAFVACNTKQAGNIQEVTQQVNLSAASNNELASKVMSLEIALHQVQLLFNETSGLLISQFTNFQLMVNTTNAEVARNISSLSSVYSSELLSAQASINSLNSSSLRHWRDFDSALVTINATRSQVTSTTSSLDNLKSRLRRVNLYSRCYEDVSSCTVGPHNTRWYFCRTSNRNRNTNVSF